MSKIYSFKKLCWEDSPASSIARSYDGNYIVKRSNSGYILQFVARDFDSSFTSNSFETEDIAKERAQNHFENRLGKYLDQVGEKKLMVKLSSACGTYSSVVMTLENAADIIRTDCEAVSEEDATDNKYTLIPIYLTEKEIKSLPEADY